MWGIIFYSLQQSKLYSFSNFETFSIWNIKHFFIVNNGYFINTLLINIFCWWGSVWFSALFYVSYFSFACHIQVKSHKHRYVIVTQMYQEKHSITQTRFRLTHNRVKSYSHPNSQHQTVTKCKLYIFIHSPIT